MFHLPSCRFYEMNRHGSSIQILIFKRKSIIFSDLVGYQYLNWFTILI